ncbi:2OG-Fe(II) oxygenase [Paraburkholderia sp. BCC1886]|uniref:2OG-Fe(II) oxygenase n=1 Tax=Paraburkholderia sp. BCC1886 TaxID=2562670 RepID=UPI0011835519|nr:2OG-Fe(II) oxygenase [Paraburkholderia sp. BCC1886]
MGKLFRWQEGRQNTGYRLFTMINSKRFALDMHLIAYPTGSSIPPHRDPVEPTHGHYRLNIEVRKAKRGGEFQCGRCLFRFWRISFFRPDIEEHSVTNIDEGQRLLLSIGWKRRIKTAV